MTRSTSTTRRRLAVALALAALAAPATPALASADDVAGSAAPDPRAYQHARALLPSEMAETPADHAQPTAKVGDTPVDHPGASRAPEFDGPPIEIVYPHETRTIVREVDAVLPIALSAGALALAFMGAGVALVRTGAVPGLRLRRTH